MQSLLFSFFADVFGAPNHSKRSPLYDYLVGSEVGGGKNIRWNFEKFVLDRSGKVVARFRSGVTPDDDELVSAVKVALKPLRPVTKK